MSEYIVEMPKEPAKVVRDGWNVRIEWQYKQREEIVRCRDCKEFSFGDVEYATVDWCDYWGAYVESPDGFCKWGETEGSGRMSATDELRKLLDEHGVEYKSHYLNISWYAGMKLYMATDDVDGTLTVDNLTPEQAVAATLGRPKAKAHPYGYEPDTGAFDCTRCECGCINDISATYCNDCGGEIEIDMYAEKEIYHIPCHLVFAEKHDDGSLEFGGKRYVAATLGNSRAERTCCIEGGYYDELMDEHYTQLSCDHETSEYEPNYCPKCGARVVGRDDE